MSGWLFGLDERIPFTAEWECVDAWRWESLPAQETSTLAYLHGPGVVSSGSPLITAVERSSLKPTLPRHWGLPCTEAREPLALLCPNGTGEAGEVTIHVGYEVTIHV